jgi:hypothetical protein
VKIRSSTTYRAEIFTISVSHQGQSSLKISAQKDDSKWQIICEGGALKLYRIAGVSDVHFAQEINTFSKIVQRVSQSKGNK